MKQGLVRLLYNFGKRFMGWTLHMIMCVLLCYPVSIHMSQLLSTRRPISSCLPFTFAKVTRPSKSEFIRSRRLLFGRYIGGTVRLWSWCDFWHSLCQTIFYSHILRHTCIFSYNKTAWIAATDYYFHQGVYAIGDVCMFLFVWKITQNFLDGYWWNFQTI